MTQYMIDITKLIPMTRNTVTQITSLATRYDCTLTIASQNVILNAKSMLGLLSMTNPAYGKVTFTADGEGEEQAIAALKDLINKLLLSAE